MSAHGKGFAAQGGITQFFLDKGYITEAELAERIADFSPPSDDEGDEGDAGIDDQVIAYLRLGDSPRRDVAHPTFAVGSAVRIANVPADAHSRLPGYLRGHVGTVERVFEGDYAYFTHTGDGIGEPMPIYIVAFEPTDIWGPRAEEGPLALYAELFEAYLEPTEEQS